MKVGSLDLNTRYEYLIVYKNKRNDTINTWTLGDCAFQLNYKQMIKDDSVEILGVYKKVWKGKLNEIARDGKIETANKTKEDKKLNMCMKWYNL